jgi:hypothetical protein
MLYRLSYLILFLLMVSCSKSTTAPSGTEPPVSDTMFNRVITVMNVGADRPDTSEPLYDPSIIYFSLETNAVTPVDYKRTSRWDLSFSGTERSFLGGNNGANTANLGYQGPGKGGICILTQRFDSVIDIPEDGAFRTGSGLIGTDDMGAYGTGTGYYAYDWGGTLFGDGSYDKQHVAHVLQDTRTVIVRTAKGNYAKIRMLSIYKDELDPSKWLRNSPHPYFSFQYILVKAGSKKFSK